jgi:hypothetical protein
LCAEDARAFAAELPRYIAMLGLNPLDIHAVRQKNREPWLWCDFFRVRFAKSGFRLRLISRESR